MQLELFEKSRIHELDWGNGKLIQCGDGVCIKNGEIHRAWIFLENNGIFRPTHEQWLNALDVAAAEIQNESEAMPILMFQPQFHRAIETGEKLQTIRPPRIRPIRPGDSLSLRASWTGAAYRSPQRELRRAVCQGVERITIGEDFADDDEARRDGFADAAAMRDWFRRVHGLPFTGDRISWT